MALSAGTTGAAAEDRMWGTAAARVEAYLVAAGIADIDAGSVAAGLIAEARSRGTATSAEEAAVRALDAARRFVIDNAARVQSLARRGQAMAPAATPTAMPRRGLRSLVDWRLASTRIRRLLPAVAPRRLRRAPPDLAPPRPSPRARLRRMAFFVLITATTAWGVASFVRILGVDGLSPLDLAHTAVFAVLLLWLAQSFWSLAAGAAVLAGRLRRGRIPAPPAPHGDAAALPRVAIIAPIYNEETRRVFAGLRTMWEDLADQDLASRVDLFVLSDTTDPDVWLAELDAWQTMRAHVPGAERMFYRRRLRNTKRKTGNIEEFVTRWGGAYGYMLVLDADSLMTGEAMAGLVRRMDENPDAGLIQAPPKLVRGRSLFARVLQTAGELYGPLSASGVSYWALGEGNYWGHNAIIRTAPFADLCGLPLLSGRAPIGGEIMSHDFVEAALLRRGGWQVWIADDLGGSYEEPPPSIADFATRDRRWCQGNMQHVKVLPARDLHWVSRLHMAIGVMSYVTSPLWLLFLLLSAAQAWGLTYDDPVYFTEGFPFPLLPVSVEGEATVLLVVTLGLLFLPKLLGIALALLDPGRRDALGGGARVVASAFIETLYSALIAPVMMLLHTSFVLQIATGGAIDWKPQRRDAPMGALRETLRRFRWPMVIGIAATLACWWATPLLLLWLSPVLAGLVLVVPLALLGNSERVGAFLAARGLLLVAEDRRPPRVFSRLEQILAEPHAERDLFAEVVLDPGFNTLHVAMLKAYGVLPVEPPPARRAAERKAVYLGAPVLGKEERRMLLEDTGSMRRLHLAAWVHWRDDDRLAWERLDPPPTAAAAGAVIAA